MADPASPDPEDLLLRLRERFPDYLAVFGVAWAAIGVVGLGVGLFTEASLVEGIAYIAMAAGVVMLLGGGAVGGGYTSLGMGAAGAVIGAGQRHDEEYDDAEVRRGRIKRVNPRERLRKGLRPEKNPRAFWQVMAGFAYLSIGLGMLYLFSG